MINIQHPSNMLKSTRFDAYEELTPNIGDEVAEEYPFESGIELFSAGLVVGYINDEGSLIDGSANDDDTNQENIEDSSRDESSELSYHPFVSLQQVMENNEEHGYTIELVHRIIAVEITLESEEKGRRTPKDVWDTVVAHADKGVGIIRQEWSQDGEIDIGVWMDELDGFWEDKVDKIGEELTQVPQREDHGRLQSES